MSSRTARTISPTKPSPPKVLTRPSKLSRTPPTKGTPPPKTTPAATPNATKDTLSALNLPEGVEIPSLALGEDRDQVVVSVAEAKILEIEPEVVEPEEGEEGEETSEGEGETDSEDSGGDSGNSEEKSD